MTLSSTARDDDDADDAAKRRRKKQALKNEHAREAQQRARATAVRKRVKEGRAAASSARTVDRYREDLRKGKASDAAFRDQKGLSSLRASDADRRALRGFKTEEQWAKAEDRAKRLRQAHPEIPQDMSNEEVAALSDYTGSHYRPVNESLRSGGQPVKGLKRGEEFSREEALAYTNCTCSALNRLPPVSESKRTVHRGTTLPPSELAKYHKGQVVADKGFSSSSTDPKVAYGPMAGKAPKHHITIRHKSGKDVAKFTNHPNESEILFAPGTKFRVVDRREGPPVEIELEEVEDEAPG